MHGAYQFFHFFFTFIRNHQNTVDEYGHSNFQPVFDPNVDYDQLKHDLLSQWSQIQPDSEALLILSNKCFPLQRKDIVNLLHSGESFAAFKVLLDKNVLFAHFEILMGFSVHDRFNENFEEVVSFLIHFLGTKK